MALTIRTRIRTVRTATGLYRGPEVQVVDGRRVVFRCDLDEQARAWIERNQPGAQEAAR